MKARGTSVAIAALAERDAMRKQDAGFRRVLQLRPGAAEIHEQSARVLAQQGKKEEAQEDTSRLVKSRREEARAAK
jgi:regulator of sirC expression with transglutaminase-like and TPR domain